MIRVHVVASTPVARAGLEAVIRTQRDFDLAAGEDAADVVIKDIESRNTAEPISEPIVLLAGAASGSIAALLRNGVRAVLPQDATPAQIIAAIYAVAAGLAVVPAEEAASMTTEQRPEPLGEPLTPRETQSTSRCWPRESAIKRLRRAWEFRTTPRNFTSIRFWQSCTPAPARRQ